MCKLLLGSFVHLRGLSGRQGGGFMCGCKASACGKEGGPSGDSVRQCPFNMSCVFQPWKTKALMFLSSDLSLSEVDYTSKAVFLNLGS